MTVNESSTDLRRRMALRFSGTTADLPRSIFGRLRYASGIASLGGFRRLVRILPDSETRAVADQKAVENIVLSLGRLKGVPMKLGQLAGYADSGVPPALRPAFAALETHAQAVPVAHMRAVLDKELGPRADELWTTMSWTPVAVGTLGQVYRAELDGTPVAVKIRYPDIERTIRLDFRPAALGSQAMDAFRRRGRRGDATIKEIMGRILDECDYRQEAERQQAFAHAFDEHPVITVPQIFSEYSTPAVLTTELAEGQHLDEYLATKPNVEARERAGLALFDFYVGSLFVLGAYNSDPHAGNYIFTDDGRVVVFDHGAGRTFSSVPISAIRYLGQAMLSDDWAGVREALGALGIVPSRERLDEAPLRRVLTWLFEPMLAPDESQWTLPNAEEVGAITKCVREYKAIELPSELVFLIRLRVALSAVLARLGVQANWREVLGAHLQGDFFLRPPPLDVVLVEPGPRPIELLRVLRDELGGAVTEAKALIDAVPCVVRSELDRDVARAVGARLTAAGAKVDLRTPPEARS